MNSISENIRYYPHDLNAKFYATKLYKRVIPFLCFVEDIIYRNLHY